MSKLTLWLVRHGESTMNRGVWTQNPAASELTETGIEQAKETAMRVTEQPDLIISSPMLRAEQTRSYISNNWPKAPTSIWPIQELIYLSPDKLQDLTPTEKKQLIESYWEQSDPLYRDGEHAESFDSFLQRVHQFHRNIMKHQGFIVAVGHGQFFKAYQLGLLHGFQASAAWMKRFRQEEIKKPMKNGEIYRITLS